MSILRCPICHQTLEKYARCYRCVSGHNFDCAKEGYINLLMSHQKRSKQPGDSKEMLLSRRRFLEAGHFDVLVNNLGKLVAQCISTVNDPGLLDLGCGEGYFLRSLVDAEYFKGDSWGIDVAKAAIQMAAKKDSNSHYAVASNRDLPFHDGVFNTVYSINAPVYAKELIRILANHGYYVRVTPGEQHLLELKRLVYREARPHEDEVLVFDGLAHLERHTVNFIIHLGRGEAYDLLAMTPYYWQASPEAQNQIEQLASFESPASFNIDVYQKR